jgi:NADH:ubiquinone oxidoreductase subunit 3 (subunit A)
MVTGVDKPPAFISLFPIAFVIAVGLVIWLLFVTRILGPRKPRTQKAVK